VEPAFSSRDTSCVCLWYERLGVRYYDYGLTGPALMPWVVLVTTVVTILRFTIPLPQQWSALGGFYPVVVLCIRHSTVLLIVPVTGSVVVPILGFTPHHSY
jgi:hypothetical protein